MRIPQTPLELDQYRFGLAGAGQADIIEGYLARRHRVLLDAGCGPQGQHTANLGRLCRRVIAFDKDPGMVASAKHDPNPPNVRFVAADAYDLPLSGESVDDIVALGLLAYIGDVRRLFAEFRRVLRRGGRIMVTDSIVREKHQVVAVAEEFELYVVDEAEGHCPAASGPLKRRRLLVVEAR